MNAERRLDVIEKSIAPKGIIPESENLQIIKGNSIKGQFVPADPADTLKSRKAALMAKYGTAKGVTFVTLIDRFDLGGNQNPAEI